MEPQQSELGQPANRTLSKVDARFRGQDLLRAQRNRWPLERCVRRAIPVLAVLAGLFLRVPSASGQG